MNKRLQLIDRLSHNLAPVTAAPSVKYTALLWLAASTLVVIALTYSFGPIRGNALQQLITQPQFFWKQL
ncbi:hypothetical protein [Dasania marina]|uniref:hypothetical protein n=1 Tax=Dasania marina TaxID=471499 RepID=UPI00037474FC|nr:hypothetical protein [Dasania marina]